VIRRGKTKEGRTGESNTETGTSSSTTPEIRSQKKRDKSKRRGTVKKRNCFLWLKVGRKKEKKKKIFFFMKYKRKKVPLVTLGTGGSKKNIDSDRFVGVARVTLKLNGDLNFIKRFAAQ